MVNKGVPFEGSIRFGDLVVSVGKAGAPAVQGPPPEVSAFQELTDSELHEHFAILRNYRQALERVLEQTEKEMKRRGLGGVI